MAEDRILKPKSFRIDDKTAEKFKEISSKIGGNQQETLAKLIEAFEFQSGKAVLTERKSDIERFEKYVSILTRMYMESLEDNQNLTETIRTEFDSLLQSKDTVILKLQSDLAVAEKEKEEAVARAQVYDKENLDLRKAINQDKEYYTNKIENLQSMLTDKDQLNEALTDSCNELKEKVDSMAVNYQEITDLRDKMYILSHDFDQLKSRNNDMELLLEKSNEDHKKEIERLKHNEKTKIESQKRELLISSERTALEIEREYQKKLQEIKEEKQNEIDQYQKKYLILLEQLNKERNSKTDA